MSRFRLLKVVVQVVGVVEDDDGNLDEITTEPTVVPAKQWREFADAGGTFDTGIEQLSARISGPPSEGDLHDV